MTALLPNTLHLVSARGGGMTRFARTLVAHGEGHALLHAGGDTWVLEAALAGAESRFTPFRKPAEPTAVADWLDALLDACAARILHVHFLDAGTLPVLEAWCARGHAWMCSLHDLGFLRADAFGAGAPMPAPDRAWTARWHALLASSAAITAPSRFLAGAFAAACPGLAVQVVAPGIDAPPALPRRARPLRSLAVVGALGAHKGWRRLLEWLHQPGAEAFRWTLIGYSEDQLQPGHAAAGRLRVHGPFEPQDTARWLCHHDVDLVLFPNLLAESFSYALSDVWAAGVPVLVPDCGALGERVRAFGGGGLLAAADDAAVVLAQLSGLRDGTKLAHWRAQIEADRGRMVPTVGQMLTRMARCQAGIPMGAPVKAPGASEALRRLQPWLRTQLDDTAFRHENIRLARDYAQVRGWAAKLAGDVERLAADAQAQRAARSELDNRLQQRDAAISALRARNAAVEVDCAALQARNAQVEADAAGLVRTAQDLQAQAHSSATRAAELSARAADLSTRLDEAHAQQAQLARHRTGLEAELAVMHQRINALEGELGPLRIKAARYDRALGWLPAPLRELARGLLQLRRLRLRARTAR